MNSALLALRSLRYYWRTNLAVMLGVATGCAVLAGALLVGSSVRGSLRDLALGKLGRFDYSIESNRFFRQQLGTQVAANQPAAVEICPAIIVRASATHSASSTRAGRVNVLGVTPAFWGPDNGPSTASAPGSTGVTINETLARDLAAKPGDEILLRIPAYSPIPSESLLGRRDRTGRTLRATISRIVPDNGLGGFELRPSQLPPRNAFVDLGDLQRLLAQPQRVNTLVVAADELRTTAAALNDALQTAVELDDLGLRLVRNRIELQPGASQSGSVFEYAAIESQQMVVTKQAEDAVFAAARESGIGVSPVLTYLANSIRKLDSTATQAGGPIVPYSVIAALDAHTPFPSIAPALNDVPQPAGIVLNTWAAARISAKVGDTIEITYYMLGSGGELRTEKHAFPLEAVVEIEGAAADRGLTPDYPGISESRTMGDWDPPFPIDYKLIAPEDEHYWEQYRATPKAFLPLRAGQELWASETESTARFGRLTSIRLAPPPGRSLDEILPAFLERLRKHLPPEQTGITIRPVKQESLSAAGGATDFGGLFIGFSMFLIAAAALLVVLLFRLAAEQRSVQIGTLLALGFTPRMVRRQFLLEGLGLAAVGGVVGAFLAIGYAALMVAGLGTLWQSAVGTSALRLHISWSDNALGAGIGVALALGSLWWAVRVVGRRPAASLVKGETLVASADSIQAPRQPASLGAAPARKSPRVARLVIAGSVAMAAAAVALSFFTGGGTRAALFFSAGALLLIAAVMQTRNWLRFGESGAIDRGRFALDRLGIRNAARRPDRTILALALIACATFVIVAVGASRHEPDFRADDHAAGHGGFALWAESDIPLVYDLNTASGRRESGVQEGDNAKLMQTRFYSFRRRPGDDASCLNLYKPQSPAILGVPDSMLRRGGFTLAKSLAESDAERNNPWLLLDRKFADGAIPAFGDENTVTWLLHLGLGDDVIMTDDRGQPLHLRIVGTLRGSVFQSELLVGETDFQNRFPSLSGYSTFLIETPEQSAAEISRVLESSLGDFGFDATTTSERLRAFLAVENTYLSTFQLLGGLGLLLGTLGVVVVLLRNILERRGELALLSAVGFTRFELGRLLVSESAAVLAAGIAIGAAAALLAIAPNVVSNAQAVPWVSLAKTLLAVFATGLLAAVIASLAARPKRLIDALRAA